ncbi:MAG: potassium channel family protein [Syntrophobacterales bacterium]
MDNDTCLPFTRLCFKNRFLYLLVFLLLMIALDPLDAVLGKFGILADLVTSAILVLAIYAVSHKRHHVVIGVLLAVPMVVSLWSHVFGEYKWLQITGHVCGMVFFAFIIVAILKFISSQDEITRDLIAGAAVVYLFVAALWAFSYTLIEMIHPGSFSIPPAGQSAGHRVNFMYYSLVTLTTLGYGDITPATGVAKVCSTLEAVIGQLYLVITVAWLVGIHVSQSIEQKSR